MLCAYLGQLLKVRDALRDEFVVVLDERDQEMLDAHNEGNGTDLESNIDRVQLTQKVRLTSIRSLALLKLSKVRIRSIDNYQGEEADVSQASY